MAPSPWPDYQCTEPKAPDKKTDVSSSGEGEIARTSDEKKLAGDDKGGNEIEIGQLKPQVTALDEYGLKALLDEAMTLRFSEDVEGKSVLLQGLFEEVNAKKPSRAVTEVPKQNSSSGKQSKKNKVRRSHAVTDQNEIVSYSKHKSDSKTQSKSIVGPKCVEPVESEACKLSSIGRINTETKKGKQTVSSSDDGQKQMGSSDEGCDMAKVVTIPGGSKNSSEGKNPKNMVKVPPVTEVDNKPKDHYSPNIEKICRKMDQKDVVDKALSISPSIKEIALPANQLNSNKIANITLPLNKTDPENEQSNIEEKKSSDLSDASKTVNSETDMSGRYLQLVGEDQLMKIKKIDENGNAVCPSKGVDDCRKGKTRRVKVKNDKNTVMSQNIEGYRGDTDIEAVIQYIESTDEKQGRKNSKHPITLPVSKQGRIPQKIRAIRDKSTEAIGRKGRKHNESKLKKCNSLEEVSSSKLEDLTSSFPGRSESKYLDADDDDDDDEDEDNDVSHMPCKFDSKAKNSDSKTETFTAAPLVSIHSVASIIKLDSKKDSRSENESDGEFEFHIVRKKQRKKKKIIASHDDQRNSKSTGITSTSFSRRFNDSARSRRGILKNFGYLEEPRGRKPAASVPPSDKSADSSDADSVHSLPVSSSSKNNAGTNESSLTSYADIARSVTTPPRGGSTPILNKPTTSLSNDLTKAHCVSSEEIPCVTLPMPKNRRPVYPSASLDITNIDKDYPPLKKVTDKKSNDMFVEFTLQLPKTNKAKGNQVTVEETVSIKRPVENKCITESTTLSMPFDDGSKRPPVILMDEKKGQESTAANELVFGFEVNQQLLAPGQSDSSQQPKEIIPQQNTSTASEEDSVENDSNDQNHSMSFNHYNIVQYISREWNLTMEELANDKSGKIVYFRGG